MNQKLSTTNNEKEIICLSSMDLDKTIIRQYFNSKNLKSSNSVQNTRGMGYVLCVIQKNELRIISDKKENFSKANNRIT